MAEPLDIESVFKLKVDELKNELGQRNLPKVGSKADLQERLLQYVTKEDQVCSTNVSTEFEDDVNITKELAEEAVMADDLQIDEEKIPVTSEEIDKSEIELADLDSSQDLNEDIQTPLDDATLPPGDDVDLDTDDVDDSEKSVADDKQNCDENTTKDDCESSAKISTLTENKTPSTTKDESSDADLQKVKMVPLPITNGVKKENRSKRFGEASSESEKKKARLGRFSTVSGLGKGEEVTEEDVEKIKKRAERFGAVSSILTKTNSSTDTAASSTTIKGSHTDRLKSRQERFADTAIKKRQERFGVIETQSLTITSDMEARKQSRLAKFGAM